MPKFIIATWINRPHASAHFNAEEIECSDYWSAYELAMLKQRQISGHEATHIKVIELSKGWTLSIPIKLTWRERLRGWFNPLSRKHL